MSARLEITDGGTGEQSSVAIPLRTVYLTVSTAGSVVASEQAEGALLRLVPTRIGHRLEPIAAGGHVVVNGQELFCKDLSAGDRFALGDSELCWRAEVPAPIGPTGAAGPAGARPRRTPATAAVRASEPAPSPESMPLRQPSRAARRSRLPVVTAFVLAIGAVAFLLRTCAVRDWPRTPQHYVDLARAQFASARLDEALATVDRALADADAEVRQQAAQLRSEIEAAMLATADAAAAVQAREDLDPVNQFGDRYLGDKVTRPIAREFVRLCDVWLGAHRERLRGGSKGQELLAEVEARRAAQLPIAEPEAPETAADVLFAVEAHLRFVTREYKAALARLDDYLRRHGDDAAVAAERERILAAGRTWLVQRVEKVQGLVDRGDRDAARSELRALEQHAVLPEWDSLVVPLRDQLK